MKYIPGTAVFSIKTPRKNKKSKIFEIKVTCDANDGDYMNDSWTQKKFNEFEILMISYLQLAPYSIPKNWKDSVDAFKKNRNYPFGGTYLEDNYRFNKDGENSWIEHWASENGYLLYAGMCDSNCHSIESIDVTYYDENGNPCKCTSPDLGKLFDSEAEFIDYIHKIYGNFYED